MLNCRNSLLWMHEMLRNVDQIFCILAAPPLAWLRYLIYENSKKMCTSMDKAPYNIDYGLPKHSNNVLHGCTLTKIDHGQ